MVSPPRFSITSRSALPIVALARAPGPRQPLAQLRLILVRTGPFTRKNGVSGLVPPSVPSGNNGSLIASNAASTTGKYSGRHPAITALAAMLLKEAGPCRGGTTATNSSGSRSMVARQLSTRSAVGGMTGSPSVHRFSQAALKKSPYGSSGEPIGTRTVSGTAFSLPVAERAFDLGNEARHALIHVRLAAEDDRTCCDQHRDVRIAHRQERLTRQRLEHPRHDHGGGYPPFLEFDAC